MGLLKRLQQLGCQLRLIEAQASHSKTPKKITTRITSLKELMSEIHNDDLRHLAEKPAELSVSWEQIFASAGLGTGKKASVMDRILQMLKSESCLKMGRPEIQRAVLQLLAENSVEVEAIVKEAVARDQILDAYEQFVQQKLRERIHLRQGKIGELENRIASLHKEIAQLHTEEENDSGQLRTWCQRKADYEKDLTCMVELLLERRKKDREEEIK